MGASKAHTDHAIELSKSKSLIRCDAPCRAVLGHDSAMEASFFVTEDALKRLQPNMRFGEAGLLSVFDANRTLIYAVAAKVYSRGRKGSYDLVSADF